MLLCEADRSSIEVAATLLLMDYTVVFNRRGILLRMPCYVSSPFATLTGVQVSIVQACLAGVKPLLSPSFDLGRRSTVSDSKDFGSVMRNVSKAKFDGNLLGSYCLEEQSQ